MTISVFFPRLLRVLKWGLLLDERRGVTTAGHSPSTGNNSLKTGFLLNNMENYSLYLTGNMLRLRYKYLPVNAV
jgi:hypothetical protein